MRLKLLGSRSNTIALGDKEGIAKELVENIVDNGGLDIESRPKVVAILGTPNATLADIITLSVIAGKLTDHAYAINLHVIAAALLHEKLEESVIGYRGSQDIDDLNFLIQVAIAKTGKPMIISATQGYVIYDPMVIYLQQISLRQYELAKIISDTEHLWRGIAELKSFNRKGEEDFRSQTGQLADIFRQVRKTNTTIIEESEGTICRKLHGKDCGCVNCNRGLRQIRFNGQREPMTGRKEQFLFFLG